MSGRAKGKMLLDRREGEAFRLVTLSSMRVNDRLWDAKSAYVDDQSSALDRAGWIVDAKTSLLASRFGLVGGSSAWKANAPTIGIELDRRCEIGGWLTRSRDPSGDNVSLWAATPVVSRAWRYTVHAWRPT